MTRLANLRQVDPVLTNLATGYTNSELVGHYLFPVAPAEKEAGKIPTFGPESFKMHNTARALRAGSNRLQPDDIGSMDFVLEEHDLEYPIDYREGEEAAFPIRAHATDVVTSSIALALEHQQAQLAQNENNYHTDNKITLSGTAQFTHKDSDPEGVIDDAKAAVRNKIVREPNTMIIGYDTFRALKRHPKLRAILSTNKNRLVKLQELKEIFQIENIYVGGAKFADQQGNFGDIWNDNVVLAYVPTVASSQERSIYSPSYGYTFRKRGMPQVDTRVENGKVELIRNTDIVRPYLVGNVAGYLIKDTNA